ncbi:hypothetical protein Tco_1380947 [Tanacetum coccineum]
MIHRPFQRRKHGTNRRRHGTTGRRRMGRVDANSMGDLGGSIGGVSRSMGSLSGRPSWTDYRLGVWQISGVRCLPAINTILELVNRLPHLSIPTTHTLQNVCLKLN